MQIFSQIQWFIFEIVSGAPLIGVCNRWYDGLGSGPLPRLAKFFWGLICPDHLAMERFRALLGRGLNKTVESLLLKYDTNIYPTLNLLCMLFTIQRLKYHHTAEKGQWWPPSRHQRGMLGFACETSTVVPARCCATHGTPVTRNFASRFATT